MMGEHGTFPSVLIRHAQRSQVEGMEFAVPRPEDQLVLQGMQRIAGRLRIALCDILFTVSTVRRTELDWGLCDRDGAATRRPPGLSCYLSYVHEIYRDVCWRPLLPAAVCSSLMLRGWGRSEYRDGGYRFPLARANARLYWHQFRHQIGVAIGPARGGCVCCPSSWVPASSAG